jgi:hypothetical protein
VGGCPRDTLPASRRSSLLRLPGGRDSSFRGRGGIFVHIRGDQANASVQGAQVSLRGTDVSRDTVLSDSTLLLRPLPTGQYSLRVHRIGYLNLMDSVAIRAGYLDTVRVALATAIVCLD